MVIQLWNWLRGYLIIKIQGAELETWLNQVASAGHDLWDIKRITSNIIIAKIGIGEFKQIRPLLGGLHVRISIVGRIGLPFFGRKLLQRKVLIIGLLACLISLYYLTGFIWFVEVAGNEKVSTEAIMAVLAENGVVVGATKKDIAHQALDNILLTEFPDLSWVGINTKGVLIKVDVVERTSPILEAVQQGDLLAATAGLVTQVLPFRGTAHVAVGDTVKKGDLLISGEYYDQYGQKQQGAAEGIVRARVWHDAIGEAALSKIVAVSTDQTHNNYSINFGRYSIRLGRKVPFANYQVESRPWQFELKDFHFPFTINRNDFQEVYYETISIDPQHAQALALERAWQQLTEAGISREDVLEVEISEYYLVDQHGVRVGLIVELEQNIAEFMAML